MVQFGMFPGTLGYMMECDGMDSRYSEWDITGNYHFHLMDMQSYCQVTEYGDIIEKSEVVYVLHSIM